MISDLPPFYRHVTVAYTTFGARVWPLTGTKLACKISIWFRHSEKGVLGSGSPNEPPEACLRGGVRRGRPRYLLAVSAAGKPTTIVTGSLFTGPIFRLPLTLALGPPAKGPIFGAAIRQVLAWVPSMSLKVF